MLTHYLALTVPRGPQCASWLAFAKVPSDLNCVRRRWWGILALYLPCKWLSVASVLCEMVYACAFPFGFAQVRVLSPLSVTRAEICITIT